MGNLTSEQQFKDKLQEFVDTKQNKKTLKIRYKESNKKAIIIESLIIKHFNNQEQMVENFPKSLHTIEELNLLKQRAQQSIFRNIQLEVICKIFLDILEPKRVYLACSKCKKKLIKNRSLIKCSRCFEYQGSETNYSIPVTISDATGSSQVIIFAEAEKYLGITAKQFALLNTNEQNQLFAKINKEYEQKLVQIGLSVNLEINTQARLPYIYNFQEYKQLLI